MSILSYTFFQNALLGSLLASSLCGLIGTYIVARRLVFISGGITHASFGGIGIGVYLGFSPILSAAVDLTAEMTQCFPSKGEMRKMVQGGGVSLNKEKLTAFDRIVTADDLLNGKYLLVQRGKKNYFLLIAK